MSKMNPFASMGTLGWGAAFSFNGAGFAPTSTEIMDNWRQNNQPAIDQMNLDLGEQANQLARQEILENPPEIRSESPENLINSPEEQKVEEAHQDHPFPPEIQNESPENLEEVKEESKEQVQEQEMSDDESSELQPLLERVQNAPIPNGVPQEQREEYRTFRERFIANVVRLYNHRDKITILTDIITKGYILYYWYKEKKQLDGSQPITAVNDQEFYEKTQKHSLPPQCRRYYYADQSGKMQSYVICESLGSQRVYFNQ